MGALPIQIEIKRELPDYLPARMVNEYAYCPRLFFYEWVEGLFAESVDTVEGAIQHRRVDAKATALLPAQEIEGLEDKTTDDARRSSELPAVAGDPGAIVGAGIGGGDCGIPGVHDAVVGCERRVGAGGAGSARDRVKVRDGGS